MFDPVAQVEHFVAKANKRPYLIGIDGLSGAGKSTFADRLAEHLPDAMVVRKDDFYRVLDPAVRQALNAEQGYNQNFDWQRLKQQVLELLRESRQVRYQRYDWAEQKLAETISIPANRIVLIEGVGSTRPELRDYYDLRIWIETSENERKRRQLHRGENTTEQIERWAASENYYARTFQPSQFAHMVLSGE